MRWFTIVVVLLYVASVGCKSTPQSERPESQPDRQAACKLDGDCEISCETRGNCCAAPCCETAVLAATIAATRSYNQEHCTQADVATCPTVGGCVFDSRPVPRCRAGACVVEKVPIGPALTVDVTGYDRSCKVDADCHIVNIAPCDRCGCAQTPIAAKEAARFTAAASAIKCTAAAPDNRQCGECMSPTPVCDKGTCIAGPPR